MGKKRWQLARFTSTCNSIFCLHLCPSHVASQANTSNQINKEEKKSFDEKKCEKLGIWIWFKSKSDEFRKIFVWFSYLKIQQWAKREKIRRTLRAKRNFCPSAHRNNWVCIRCSVQYRFVSPSLGFVFSALSTCQGFLPKNPSKSNRNEGTVHIYPRSKFFNIFRWSLLSSCSAGSLQVF